MNLLEKFLAVLLVISIVLFAANYAFVEGYSVSKFNGSVAASTVRPVKTTVGVILDAVRIAGIGIALVIFAILGIKIMLAAPSEKAAIKQYAINYIIGALILVGASTILGIIKDFANDKIKVGVIMTIEDFPSSNILKY